MLALILQLIVRIVDQCQKPKRLQTFCNLDFHNILSIPKTKYMTEIQTFFIFAFDVGTNAYITQAIIVIMKIA